MGSVLQTKESQLCRTWWWDDPGCGSTVEIVSEPPRTLVYAIFNYHFLFPQAARPSALEG